MPSRYRLKSWFWMPVRCYAAVRRSITAASASLLLVTILSLNIVWGYPWLGIFAAATTLMAVGFVANRLFGPRFKLQLSPPSYAFVGQPFQVTVHLRHRGFLPTFDNRLGFRASRQGLLTHRRPALVPPDQNDSRWLSFIQAGGRTRTELSLMGSRRGVYQLPEIEATTAFPFDLFECRRRYASRTSIAVAPAPLDRDTDSECGRLIDQISEQSRAWLAGDSYDYAGNREYQVGMPVRRWDFRSWARLGRPIVQEFQSLSTQSITLIVDASLVNRDESSSTPAGKLPAAPWLSRRGKRPDPNHDFEELLRWVATAIDYFSRTSFQVSLYLSCHPAEEFLRDRQPETAIDMPRNMVRLAAAQLIKPERGRQRIERVLTDVEPSTTFLFTLRSDWQVDESAEPNAVASDIQDRIDSVHVLCPRIANPSLTHQGALS